MGFSGYHGSMKVGSTDVVYAVIARCKTVAMSSVTAHELFEAATDPYFSAYQGFSDFQNRPNIGGEIGDLCEGRTDVVPSDVGYPVPRIWSNAAASAGHDPCQPSSATYFRTMTASSLITLAPGDTTTIDLVAFSDADTGGPWSIQLTSGWGQVEDKLALSLCRTTAQNGEHIPLTISRTWEAKQATSIGITSTLGDVTSYWNIEVALP